jgi:hypothetical protein
VTYSSNLSTHAVDGMLRLGDSVHSWAPLHIGEQHFMQLDLGTTHVVYGVMIRGHVGGAQWTTNLNLSTAITSNGPWQQYPVLCNTDDRGTVAAFQSKITLGRYVRLTPVSKTVGVSLPFAPAIWPHLVAAPIVTPLITTVLVPVFTSNQTDLGIYFVVTEKVTKSLVGSTCFKIMGSRGMETTSEQIQHVVLPAVCDTGAWLFQVSLQPGDFIPFGQYTTLPVTWNAMVVKCVVCEFDDSIPLL